MNVKEWLETEVGIPERSAEIYVVAMVLAHEKVGDEIPQIESMLQEMLKEDPLATVAAVFHSVIDLLMHTRDESVPLSQDDPMVMVLSAMMLVIAEIGEVAVARERVE